MNNHVNAGGSPSAPGGRASAGEIEKEMPPGEPAGGSAAGRKVRAAFYIDGFNLYHAIDRSLRTIAKERDDALRVAEIVRQLATPPISDEDVARAIDEAKRVRQEIEGGH